MAVEQGPPTGDKHKGRDIPAWIVAGGTRMAFDRVAVEVKGGGVDLAQMRRDECVIAPGLIYRKTVS